tara:strand:- start:8696 stop:9115 length:420 start_codon:yes stop_codon:yes gene_type:complete
MAAIDEFRTGMGLNAQDSTGRPGTSEAGSQQRARLEAAQRGEVLWRNNVGACEDNRGNHIRYGLANESKQMNSKVKSSDLIGITPVVVVPEMVGHKIGVFTAREVKKPGWKFAGTPREIAQSKFGEIVLAHGGDFKFIT